MMNTHLFRGALRRMHSNIDPQKTFDSLFASVTSGPPPYSFPPYATFLASSVVEYFIRFRQRHERSLLPDACCCEREK
jgi:hypothetical protein